MYYSQKYKTQIPIKSDLKMDVTGSGVDFYYWINLWYSSLDLIKVYLEEIQEELQKTINPGFCIHPKLKFKASIRNIKYSPEENKNEPKEKINQEIIELQQVKSDSDKQKENIAGIIKNNHIIKDDDIYFKHNFKPYDGDLSGTPVFDSPDIQSLNHIIGKLNHNTDLNIIVDVVSKLKLAENVFIKENLNIYLHSHELDKEIILR